MDHLYDGNRVCETKIKNNTLHKRIKTNTLHKRIKNNTLYKRIKAKKAKKAKKKKKKKKAHLRSEPLLLESVVERLRFVRVLVAVTDRYPALTGGGEGVRV